MKPNTTLVTIPALSDSATLAKFQTPGDPVVIVKMTSVGNNQPYTHRAGDKSFIFRWASDQQGHILRVPLALWMQNKAKLAHELLDQRQSSRSLVVLFEMPESAPMEQPSLTDPLIAALIADPEFAWSWHCNIAMACFDKGARTHAQCNAGAALFLSRLTDGKVDTTSHPAYAEIQGGEPVAETPFTSAPTTTPESPEMGAADTPPAQNVVGLSEEPTAAPAVEEFRLPVMHAMQCDPVEFEHLRSGITGASEPGTNPPGTIIPDAKAQPTVYEQAYDLCDAPRRIKALASLLGVEESALREAIDLPESRVEVTGPGWVRRKESQPA